MPRTIAIGDVHGCASEFEALLSILKPQPEDRIIQVGDLVNRGPNSHDAVSLAREYKVSCLLGNHELRLLKAREDPFTNELKNYDLETLNQLTESDWDFLKTFSNYLHFTEQNTVFVHAGFLPTPAWYHQAIETITEIQVVDADGHAARSADAPNAVSWVDVWPGSPFVVYGHTPRPKVCKRPGSIGIDTGCVYGGYLTAYIVQDKTIVQVPARKAYVRKNSMKKIVSSRLKSASLNSSS